MTVSLSAACNIIGYVFLFVVVGAIVLFVKCWQELRRMKGHHPQGYAQHGTSEEGRISQITLMKSVSCRPYVPEKVPTHILTIHSVVMAFCFLLTIVTTSGYISACDNLHDGVR